MGSSSSVQNSNPGSAEGSENVDIEAQEDVEENETNTNSFEHVVVLETEVLGAAEGVAQSLFPKLEKRILYDKQKQYWGEDDVPYSRHVQYACQCPKGHALVPVVTQPSVGISHLKCVSSPRSSQCHLKTKVPVLTRATQNNPPVSDFEWDPLQLIVPKHSEAQQSRKQNDLLRTACAEGDLDLVSKLLDQGVDVNCQDEMGVTPLHACAFASNLKLAQFLLRRGADQMQGDASEMAPIHYAAAEGALELVRFFIECAGTDVAGLIGIHGVTPAHMAAHNGHSEVLSYISEVCGPESCDQLDSQGHSPLHLASSRGHTECVDVLLQMQIDCRAHLNNSDQWMSSMVALNAGSHNFPLPITELFENGELIKSQELDVECESVKSLIDVEIDGTTKLHKAVCCGFNSEMAALLFGGTKVDVFDGHGFTPFHYACSKNRLDMVALMLNFGNHEELGISLLKHGTVSPLMCAISNNYSPLVQYLVGKFPSWIEVRNSEGVVPVAAALDNSCCLALVRALVIGGADLKAIAKKNLTTSRMHAHGAKKGLNANISVFEYASNFETEAAHFVLTAGLEPVATQPHWCAELARNIVIWRGPDCPPAHKAAFSGRVPELQNLLRVRGDLSNARDAAGFTALHAACAGGVLRIVDVLLKSNFIVDASDNEAGVSPLFFAVNGGFPLLVERLMPLVLDASTLYNSQGCSLLSVLPADESASMAISTTILSIFPFVDDSVENQNVAAHIEHMRINVQTAASCIVNTDPVSLSDLLTQMPLLIYCRMNSEGHTLLHMACERLEAVMCVELLCSKGAPVEAVMSNGLSALHVAALHKNLAAMKILLSYGASTDLADFNGLTPLHIAVIGTHPEGIDLLVKDWHAELNVDDFEIDRGYDAASEAAEISTSTCTAASGHASTRQDVTTVTRCSDPRTLICHACSVSTLQSTCHGWFECSIENCSNFYALCVSCMNILTSKDPTPASPLLKFLGKSDQGVVSQTPKMPIVDSSKSGLSFDKKGVRLDFLRAFKSQHSGDCRHLTTEQICYLLIKPQTSLHRCSVVYQLSRTDQFQYFGQNSNWFVSHAWDNLFFPMIDAILNFFEHRADADKAIIWIDLFCISQHTNPESPVSPMWWIAFSKCIQQAGRMLWVIDNWMQPRPLRRSWCLMEALTILRELAKHRAGLFKILIVQEAHQQMLRAARDTPEEFCSALSKLIGSVDVESSECTFEQEQIGILKQLQKMGTFDMLNFNISEILEDWVFEMLRTMALEMIEVGDEDELFRFRFSLAMVFTERGRLHEALQQRELRLDWKYKLLDKHEEAGSADITVHTVALADALLDVAESYAILNRFEDSLKFQKEAKKYYQRVLHEDDMRHAKIMACIAQTHLNLEKGEAALKLMSSTLQFHIRVLPQHDPRIFCAEAAVASMHRSMQNFTSALELEKQVLEKRLQYLPLNHPDIGSSHFSIALTLPFIESLPVPERNSSIVEHLLNALAVWRCSLKPSDPRLLQASQKLEMFEELMQKEPEAPDNATW